MRAAAIVALFACAGCTHSSLDLEAPGGDLVSPVTVSRTMVAGTAALASFPLLVRATAHADLRDTAHGGRVTLAGAADLRFEIGGIEVPREIERWNGETGELAAWVLLPSLDPAADLVMDLHFGGAASALDPSSVWADYAGVWHLSDDASQTLIADSSPAATDGTSSGFSASGSVAGVAGGALAFTGAEGVNLGQPPALAFGANASFTYSMWVNAAPALGSYDIPFWNGGSSNAYPGFDVELGTLNWNGCLNDGADNVCAIVGYEADLQGAWHLLAFSVDRSSGTFDGHRDDTHPWVDTLGAIDSLSPIFDAKLGTDLNETDPYNGVLDEVRVAAVARSGDWIATEYANVTSAGLVVIGPAQSQ